MENALTRAKKMSAAMRAAGIVKASNGYPTCDAIDCTLCKKPLGAKDPGYATKNYATA